jgi:hypothetical protein
LNPLIQINWDANFAIVGQRMLLATNSVSALTRENDPQTALAVAFVHTNKCYPATMLDSQLADQE